MDKINTYDSPYHWSLQGFWKKSYELPFLYFQDKLKKTDVALDVGCGDGRLTAFLAENVKKVIGLDHQQFPVEMAKLILQQQGVQNAIFEVGDARKLRFTDGSFDVVTCFDVIEHLPREDAEKLVKELTRVLKKGGWMCMTTPNRKFLTSRIFGHTLIEKHYYEYCVEELQQLFEKDFQQLEVYGVYLPLIPLPRIEHYANVLPCRWWFNWCAGLGKHHPRLGKSLVVIGQKRT